MLMGLLFQEIWGHLYVVYEARNAPKAERHLGAEKDRRGWCCDKAELSWVSLTSGSIIL